MLLRAKLGVAAACLLGTLAAAMWFLPVKVVTRQTETGQYYFQWVENGLSDDFGSFAFVYLIVFEIVLKCVVPFMIILPIIVMTVCVLLRQSRERRSFRQGTTPGKPDYATTITLVAIVVAFIILRGPFMIMWAIYVSKLMFPQWLTTLSYISASLIILSPTCNFFIYFVTGSAFRRRLRQLLVCKPPTSVNI